MREDSHNRWRVCGWERCLPQKPPHNSDTEIDQEHVQCHSLVPRGNSEFLLKPERVRPSRNKNILTGISVSILRFLLSFYFIFLFHVVFIFTFLAAVSS